MLLIILAKCLSLLCAVISQFIVADFLPFDVKQMSLEMLSIFVGFL